MSNKKKKSKSKASESHNRGGRENSPRGQHNSPSSQRDDSISDQQGSENSGTGSGTNGIKVAARLFRNPLFSKRGFKHAKEGLKSESSGDSISGLRCLGCGLLVLYPILMIGYSIAGFLSGDKNNRMYVFLYGSPLFTAVPYCILYLDNVDRLLLSIFEIGEKSLLEYFADPGIRELLLTVFEIVGFIYQCVKGRQNFWIFICGIAGFICYLVGNTLLIWERKKRPKPAMADSA
ncbi:hypothetical protein ZYGR_0D00100 [Zygosaccharomyces rouxii]|uniref:ZYRO0A13838p n=2 Tax=Zygosaccharomyces rouxii TaxID=4956 RepID=C5DP32_ZYGRC|nr:uncharacterized protein ZYRO0A13838g [Zygosaccharomyces rouxii]KAH9198454.1 hypothetical protein LQ764DRAFT_134852 [Zygosaccharomyces rouxii]GAV46998.1 hypothetical protein ZYGR_0D00100 [Zygosaccharomyces rouxii]CAR26023.1 ZYRO0A13838p [Zygosaccharomyces rouxii]